MNIFKYIKTKYIQFFVCEHDYVKIKTIPTFENTTMCVIEGNEKVTFKCFDKFRCKKCHRIKYGDYYLTDNIC